VNKFPVFQMLAVVRQVRRYADAASIQAAVRELSDPTQILSYYSSHQDMDIACLGAVMTGLSNVEANASKLVANDSFRGLINQISQVLPQCDARALAEFAAASGQFGFRSDACPELFEFSLKLAEVACLKPNGFPPKHLTSLALGLAQRGVRDYKLIEFIRLEAIKTLQDFTPQQLAQLLEAFRRWGDFNRSFVDSVTERMTDLIDRYNSKDVVLTITVLSKMSLGRGFLLRRLSQLVFDNLSEFETPQVVYALSGLARLRFLSSDECDDLLDVIDTDRLTPKLSSEILFAAGLLGCAGRSELLTAAAKLVDTPLSADALSDAAWGLCSLGMTEEARRVADLVFKLPVTKARPTLQKMIEVSAELGLAVNAGWKGGMEETEKTEQDRVEGSRMHADVLRALSEANPKIKWVRSAAVGPTYRVDFYDEANKKVVDVDTLARPINRRLKHKQLKAMGFDPVVIEYWKFRQASRSAESLKKMFETI